jgi:ribonuclease BN (tRNA processing enzyme)
LVGEPELLDGVERIDVCLSHFHLDHVVGLSYLPAVPPHIERFIWGPGAALYEASTATILEHLIGPPMFGLTLDRVASRTSDLPLGESEIGPFTVITRDQQMHPQPSVALRVGDELTYCTDTGYDPNNARFAAECRHLLHEAFWPEHPVDNWHSTAAQAARIAEGAAVVRLTLVHINPLSDSATDRLLHDQSSQIFTRSHVGTDLAVLE